MSSRPARKKVTPFTIEFITDLRDKCRELGDLTKTDLDLKAGWNISPVDPDQILAIFKSIKLPENLHLVAFQALGGIGGNSIVMLWPKGVPVQDPKEVFQARGGDDFLSTQMYPHSRTGGWVDPGLILWEIMEAITGDDSPLSYLEASVFLREIFEFGAFWHGKNWSSHHIVDKSVLDPKNYPPQVSPTKMPTTNPLGWKWKKEQPADWTPRVIESGDKRFVEFYSYSGHFQQTIFFHRDSYKEAKNYKCQCKMYPIADGPGGYFF
jgi:hypothetical protein